MADVTNLTQFLTDVAGAIKEKTGKEEKIPAANFDEEILNIQTKEDLIEVLTEQDTIITTQENTIDDLMTAINNKSRANNIKLNVFLQDEEPKIKEGIWLQNGELTFDDIAVDESIVAQEEWDMLHHYTDIPYNFYYGSATLVGTDIYLFGGSGNNKASYKYDTLADTYTKLSDIPYEFYYGSTVAIGTDIYLFGGSGGRTTCYKYDTLTDTYTKLNNIGVYSYFHNGSVVSTGTDIYLLGSASRYSRDYYTCCKYDTLTNTYTALTEIPYAFHDGSAILIGTDIYLLGGSESKTTCYKYDILADKYTKLSNIPYNFYYGSATLVGTDIYLFGGSGNNKASYKYDTLTDTYTKLTDIPYEFCYSSAISTGTDIYLLGGTNKTKIQVMNLVPKDYSDNSIVISQSYNYNSKKTQLLGHADITGRLLQHFNDAWHYTTEGKLNKTIPTYYGDGEKWIKFKN